MIMSNNLLSQTIMFLIDAKISERIHEVRNFIFSERFNSFHANSLDIGISTYSFKLLDEVPVVLNPEEKHPEDQELILTTLFLEVCPEGDSAYFVLYIDDESNVRIEGDLAEAFHMEESFITPEDLDLELSIMIDDQENHERFSYKAAYHKIIDYMKQEDPEFEEEMPF